MTFKQTDRTLIAGMLHDEFGYEIVIVLSDGNDQPLTETPQLAYLVCKRDGDNLEAINGFSYYEYEDSMRAAYHAAAKLMLDYATRDEE